MKCPKCGRKIWQTSWMDVGDGRVPIVLHKYNSICMLNGDQMKELTRMLIDPDENAEDVGRRIREG